MVPGMLSRGVNGKWGTSCRFYSLVLSSPDLIVKDMRPSIELDSVQLKITMARFFRQLLLARLALVCTGLRV